jgi:ribonuclease VapC
VSVVLDASAVLAYLRNEPGADVVGETIGSFVADGATRSVVSAVNWSEIAQRVCDPAVLEDLASVVEVVALDREIAEVAAGLWEETKSMGLSLADRACLATAISTGWPAMTADRAWAGVRGPVEVQLIR